MTSQQTKPWGTLTIRWWVKTVEPTENQSNRDDENYSILLCVWEAKATYSFQEAGVINGIRFSREVKEDNEEKVPIGFGD